MHRGLKAIIGFCILLAGSGCASTSSSEIGPDVGHSSRNSLDWAGSYRGVFPCADCPGIQTIVTLKADNTYVSSSTYLGNQGRTSTQQGTFRWDETGNVISLSGDEPAHYRVGEGRLIRLALDGSSMTGALADRYVLKKVD
jgi:uncharacterized lipoprotein NlpE involved in copper resistance